MPLPAVRRAYAVGPRLLPEALPCADANDGQPICAWELRGLASLPERGRPPAMHAHPQCELSGPDEPPATGPGKAGIGRRRSGLTILQTPNRIPPPKRAAQPAPPQSDIDARSLFHIWEDYRSAKSAAVQTHRSQLSMDMGLAVRLCRRCAWGSPATSPAALALSPIAGAMRN